MTTFPVSDGLISTHSSDPLTMIISFTLILSCLARLIACYSIAITTIKHCVGAISCISIGRLVNLNARAICC